MVCGGFLFSVSLDSTLHVSNVFFLFGGSRALFTGPASMKKCKSNFKIESHDTIHILKNYFTTVFLVFSSNKWYPNTPLLISLKTIIKMNNEKLSLEFLISLFPNSNQNLYKD